MARPTRLTDEQVRERLGSIPGWDLAGDKLHREFRFKDFKRAFSFMTAVALVAEGLDHHPDWSNVYNKVRVHLTTHEAGGLTQRDLDLAARMDALAAGA